jgi:hypothetical protein
VTVVTNGLRFRGDDSCRTQLDEHGITLLEQDAVRFVGERGDLRASSSATGGCSPPRS